MSDLESDAEHLKTCQALEAERAKAIAREAQLVTLDQQLSTQASAEADRIRALSGECRARVATWPYRRGRRGEERGGSPSSGSLPLRKRNYHQCPKTSQTYKQKWLLSLKEHEHEKARFEATKQELFDLPRQY